MTNRMRVAIETAIIDAILNGRTTLLCGHWQMLGKRELERILGDMGMPQVDHIKDTLDDGCAQRRITSHVAESGKAASRLRGNNIDQIIYDELMPHESS